MTTGSELHGAIAEFLSREPKDNDELAKQITLKKRLALREDLALGAVSDGGSLGRAQRREAQRFEK